MTAYKLNTGFIVRKLDGRTIIYDSRTSNLFSLNDTATFIFRKIKAGIKEETIIEILIKKYGIKSVKAEKDVTEFFQYLLANKIVSLLK